jgi:hypothetical protein
MYIATNLESLVFPEHIDTLLPLAVWISRPAVPIRLFYRLTPLVLAWIWKQTDEADTMFRAGDVPRETMDRLVTRYKAIQEGIGELDPIAVREAVRAALPLPDAPADKETIEEILLFQPPNRERSPSSNSPGPPQAHPGDAVGGGRVMTWNRAEGGWRVSGVPYVPMQMPEEPVE